MLTSRPLFNDPVEMKILDLVRKSIVPPIAQYNPNVTPELEAIIKKGLARNRADRYQSAKEFADALRGYMNKLGNPPTELGSIIAKIKPPEHQEEEEIASQPAPMGATAADDDVKPHTRSELIPIDALRKAAEDGENLLTDEDGVPKQIDDSWDNDATLEMPPVEEFHITPKHR